MLYSISYILNKYYKSPGPPVCSIFCLLFCLNLIKFKRNSLPVKFTWELTFQIIISWN